MKIPDKAQVTDTAALNGEVRILAPKLVLANADSAVCFALHTSAGSTEFRAERLNCPGHSPNPV